MPRGPKPALLIWAAWPDVTNCKSVTWSCVGLVSSPAWTHTSHSEEGLQVVTLDPSEKASHRGWHSHVLASTPGRDPSIP